MMIPDLYHSLFKFSRVGHQIFGGPDSSMYRGEAESIVHVAYTYARNSVHGDDMDAAFSSSISVKDQCHVTNASPEPQTGCQSYKQNIYRVPVMSVDDA